MSPQPPSRKRHTPFVSLVASSPAPSPRRRGRACSAGRLGLLLAVVASVALAGSPPAAGAAPMSWSAPIALDTTGGMGAMRGVACPTATSRCTAVEKSGQQVTFDPTAPGEPTPTTVNAPTLLGVACPSTVQCTAVDDSGRQVTFDPTAPGSPTPTTIDGSNWLSAVLPLDQSSAPPSMTPGGR